MNTIASAALNAARRSKTKGRRLLASVVAAIERTRYGRVAVAVARFAWKRLPKWPRRMLALTLAIPGPQDEILAAVIVAAYLVVLLAVSRNARRELAANVRIAWKGI